MKLKYIALAAGVAIAAPASAQTIVSGPVTQTDGPVNNYAASPVYGSVLFSETFEGTVSSRFSGVAVENSSVGGSYVKPTGDTSTFYGAALAVPKNIATLNTTGLGAFNQVSLYWGSQDSYNLLSFYNGTTLLAQFNGGVGQAGAESAYETYSIAPSAVGLITSITFESVGNNAFEFDNVVIGTAVPEPASWALMIAGVGMVGGALRRKGREKVSVKFAAA